MRRPPVAGRGCQQERYHTHRQRDEASGIPLGEDEATHQGAENHRVLKEAMTTESPANTASSCGRRRARRGGEDNPDNPMDNLFGEGCHEKHSKDQPFRSHGQPRQPIFSIGEIENRLQTDLEIIARKYTAQQHGKQVVQVVRLSAPPADASAAASLEREPNSYRAPSNSPCTRVHESSRDRDSPVVQSRLRLTVMLGAAVARWLLVGTVAETWNPRSLKIQADNRRR